MITVRLRSMHAHAHAHAVHEDLVVDPSETVGDLRRRFEEHYDVPFPSSRLFHYDTDMVPQYQPLSATYRLSDKDTLESRGIGDGDTIFFDDIFSRSYYPPLQHSDLVQSSKPAKFQTSFSGRELRIELRHDVNVRAYVDCNVGRFEGDTRLSGWRYSKYNAYRRWDRTHDAGRERALLLELDPAFVPGGEASSPAFQAEMTRRIDTVRYAVDGANRSYYGGDRHSWQRYTRALPIEATLAMGASALVLHPHEPLRPGTWYAIALLHISNHRTEPHDEELFEPASMPTVFGKRTLRRTQSGSAAMTDALLPFKTRIGWDVARLLFLGSVDPASPMRSLEGQDLILHNILDQVNSLTVEGDGSIEFEERPVNEAEMDFQELLERGGVAPREELDTLFS